LEFACALARTLVRGEAASDAEVEARRLRGLRGQHMGRKA
jgi:hypothetical protein